MWFKAAGLVLVMGAAGRLLRRNGEYFAAALAYLSASVAFYRSELFGDAMFPVDLPDFDYPRFYFLATWFHRHILPLWDPHVGFGIPLAGIMGCQTFYPPLYIALFLGGPTPSVRVVEWVTISHVAWAGLGVYALCRALHLSRAASFTAGLVFAFGGFFALRVFHGAWVATAAWFPFALAAWARFLETRKLRYAAWLSAVFLIMMMAGFWQQVLYSMYFTLFWGLWESACLFLRAQRGRKVLVPVLVVIASCGAALVGDACELLPTYQYARNTARQNLTFADSAGTGLRPSDVPAILWAGEFTGADGAKLWSARRVNSSIRDYYPGTLTLILLAYSLCVLVKRPTRNQVFLWCALLVFAAASFGSATPIFWLFYKLAPGFSFFRRSSSLYYFPILAAAVLCAYGLDDIVSRAPAWQPRKIARALLFFGIALAAAVWLVKSRGAGLYLVALLILSLALFAVARFPSRASLIVYGLAGMCLADLYYFHAVQFNFVLHLDEYPRVNGIPEIVNSPTGPYRVALAPFGGAWDNYGEVAGFDNPGGYMVFRLQRYQDYFARIQSPQSPLLARASARYLLTSAPLMRDGMRRTSITATENRMQITSGPPAPPYFPSGIFPGRLQLFRNDTALPRYYFTSSAEVVRDASARLDRLSDPLFGTRAALVETDLGISIDNCSNDAVKVLDITPNRISLGVVSHGNCLFVTSDSYDPDWTMYVDGRKTTVYLANSVFRAAVIREGTHLAEWKYEPRSLLLGMAISISSGLTFFGMFAGLRSWGRKKLSVPGSRRHPIA